MGALTGLVVTGASGFVGAACVAEARARSLHVYALCRAAPRPEWQGDDGITPVQLDLTAPEAAQRLAEVLGHGTALIHAAAHLGGDPQALARDTVGATGTVLAARRQAGARMVLISSLAVYDTDLLSPGDALTEDSPLIALPDDALFDPDAAILAARDPYAGAKRLQEMMLTGEAAGGAWILRPGAIWGPGRSWHGLMGFWASKLFVTIGSDGELPLSHVDHVAWAAVEAALTPTPGVAALNVFDDDRPTRARFLKAHRRCHGWPRLNLTVPFGAWLGLVRLVRPVSARLPGLFREPILRARMMPLRFPNSRLRGTLGGEDRDTFEGMMARTPEGAG